MAEERSTFVTVVAWLFMGVAGLMAFTSSVQAVAFAFLINAHIQEQMGQMAARGMPAYVVYIYQHLAAYALAVFLASCITLVAAIGLLRRQDWARRLFIAIMVLGIAVTLLAPIVLIETMHSVAGHSAARLPPAPSFDVFLVVFVAVNAIPAIGAACLYGWIIKRLVSPRIRREFGVA